MQVIEIEKLFNERPLFNHKYCNIDTLKLDDLNYNTFFETYMLQNIPCIVKNVSSSWKCSQEWITNDVINYDHLRQKYGNLDAPVAICDSVTFNTHRKINMKVQDYIDYLEKIKKENMLYLKDWHLKKIKYNEEFYEVPIIFASDWLNEYAMDYKEDDFMFVYIGPQNSWTPLHADVYSSYSWSVNIIGRKKWLLFPPGEEVKLKDSLGNLPLLFKTEDCENIHCIEVIQEKGDAIFVPSGWYHQVTNQLDTISINHNWINACNIETVWKALESNLLLVENEIKEFRDTPEFISQCQLILKSLFGMDCSDFVNFLCYIGTKRLAQLKNNNDKYFNNFKLGIQHIKFDLLSIMKTMNLIINHHLFIKKQLPPNLELDLVNTNNKISFVLNAYL